MSVWEAGDVVTDDAANQKMVVVDTGTNIEALAETFAGQLAYPTAAGATLLKDVLYERNAANDAWVRVVRVATLDRQSGGMFSTAWTDAEVTAGENWSPPNSDDYFSIWRRDEGADSTTESSIDTSIPFAMVVDTLIIEIDSNTLDATANFYFRDDGADVGEVAIGAGLTGEFTDTSIGTEIAAGSLVNYKFTENGATGEAQIKAMAVLYKI